ncbi:hypothetical protein GC197_17595 [bacterium]|nr:hypothetical protein [bacterium]
MATGVPGMLFLELLKLVSYPYPNMPHPDSTDQPKRPHRETWGVEIALGMMAVLVLMALLAVGLWLLFWAFRPASPKLPPNDQDPEVTEFRRVGFEIGRDSEDNIQVITTPNPLLVTDKDLAMVTGLQELLVLDLRGTQITDDALAHLTDLPKLQQLFVGGSVVTDTEPTLFHARFTDAAVDPVVKLSTLKILSLARTDIGDESVKKLPVLTNLEILFLLGTNITDASVEPLSQMKSLKELYVEETAITPEGVAKLRAALPDTKIMSSGDDRKDK